MGIELDEVGAPPEDIKDFQKQKRDTNLPFWVVSDIKGVMNGLLHICRRFEFCKDVIVLISDETPKGYVTYLEDRDYNYHIVGKEHIDLGKTFELLSEKYHVKTILTDTGWILGNLL